MKRSDAIVEPSDIGQSLVRLVLVSAIIVWSLYNERPDSIAAFVSDPLLLSFPFYLIYSVGFLALSYWFERRGRTETFWSHVKRVIGLLVDLVSCAVYMFLAGEYALAIYPVYITIVVGYGLRFGVPYLVLAILVALASFSIIATSGPVFSQFGSLTIGFYLGLILIPGYAGLLLKKYQDLLRRLTEMNAARARFIANMSHELRTPLHAIIGNAEVLRARLEEYERNDSSFPRLSRSAGLVTEASEHLRALVDGVLDVASNEAGTFVLGQPARTDFYRLIRSAIEISKSDTRRNPIEVFWNIDLDVPRHVETWEKHFKAVLINTIGNAVKYTHTGWVSVTVRSFHQDPISAATLVRIEIEDTGVGISKEHLTRLFEPFSIGDDSRARRFEGTGLGLTITKQYLEEMRGTIKIDSRLGVGTRVVIDVPVLVLDTANQQATRPLNVLLVSASERRHEYQNWLCRESHTCACAEFGGEAIVGNGLRESFDVVLIDAEYSSHIGLVTKLAKLQFADSLIAVLGDVESVEVQTSWATQVQYGNNNHLHNLYSLVDTGEEQLSAQAHRTCRILMVDDNETNLQSAEIALQSFGHDVVTTTSGKAALGILRQEKFDLVFMDMHMPGLSGIEISTAYAAEEKSPAPVVILTADATKTASADAKIPAVVGFLTKPIKPYELQDAVQNYSKGSLRLQRNKDQRMRNHALDSFDSSQCFSKDSYYELMACDADTDALQNLIDKYRLDADEIIGQLHRAASLGDIDGSRRLLHKLQGSAAAMYIAGLYPVISYYQNSDETECCRSILRDIDDLKHVIALAAAAISSFVGEGSDVALANP